MDPTPAAQRRLKAIHSHLIPAADSPSHLQPNPTAGEFVLGSLSLSLSHEDSDVMLLCVWRIICLFCG